MATLSIGVILGLACLESSSFFEGIIHEISIIKARKQQFNDRCKHFIAFKARKKSQLNISHWIFANNNIDQLCFAN